MATDLNYIKYVVEQIDLPDISFKKMFGEYMVYYSRARFACLRRLRFC